ncbi:MAG: hypothetical protein OEY28_10470 [Nitrospira sp.]|nr:hypothetical protein [Nitrospira sp.]
MKRIAAGALWFLILYFGIIGIGGAVVGTVAAQGAKNSRQSHQTVYAASEAFGKKYGTIILIVAASAAALGTVTSRLPGTKPKGS